VSGLRLIATIRHEVEISQEDCPGNAARPRNGKLLNGGKWNVTPFFAQSLDWQYCAWNPDPPPRSSISALAKLLAQICSLLRVKRSYLKSGSLAVYDNVGFVKAIFAALGRENCAERRRCGEAGVKGAFFAFISTLDAGLPTSTIGLGRMSGSF
jgi:hypothetical protein